jgi:hypothetical protein
MHPTSTKYKEWKVTLQGKLPGKTLIGPATKISKQIVSNRTAQQKKKKKHLLSSESME